MQVLQAAIVEFSLLQKTTNPRCLQGCLRGREGYRGDVPSAQVPE